MRLRLVGMVALLLGAFPAAADETEELRFAVLDVVGLGAVDTKKVGGLSPLIASEISALPNVSVIRGAEINALVGLEAQKQLLGCGDAGCLAEIGGALGVHYLVQTEITEVGGQWLIALVLLDVDAGRAAGRITRDVDGESALVAATRSAVAELLALLPEFAPNAPALPSAAPTASGRSTLSWVGLGAGGVAAVVGGVLYSGAWVTSGKAKSSPLDVSRQQRDNAERNAGIGIGALGAGVALVVAGLLFPGDEGATLVAVVPMKDGVAIGFRFSFDGPRP